VSNLPPISLNKNYFTDSHQKSNLSTINENDDQIAINYYSNQNIKLISIPKIREAS
jgi:hypothetical protein